MIMAQLSTSRQRRFDRRDPQVRPENATSGEGIRCLHRQRGSEHRCHVWHYAMHLPPTKAELSNGTGTGMLVVRNLPPSILMVAMQQIRLVDAVIRAVRPVTPNRRC
jgi:hypothetical protein